MEVHQHFQQLGLKRGASESDMRKAYHQKALQYHPDRNPNGGDIFKRVHTAYEALQKHYKSHGGIDFVGSQTSVVGGFAATARTNSSSGQPLFTEEELFRDAGLGGTSKFASSASSFFSSGLDGGDGDAAPRRFPHRPFRQSRAAPPESPPMFNQEHEKVSQQFSNAHRGHHAPVSGYDPFNGDPASMEAFVSQSKHFNDMEERKAKLAKAAQQCNQHQETTTGSAPYAARAPKAANSPSNSGTDANNDASSPPTDASAPRRATQPCHQQLSDEWQAQRKAQQEIERARAANEEAERQSRKLQIERETREEWARMNAEMDREVESKRVKVAMDDAHQRINKQRETNQQLQSLQEERRELKRELYRRRMPMDGELNRLTSQELYIMQQVLEESLNSVSDALRARLRPAAPCCVCTLQPKEGSGAVKRFYCSHVNVACAECSRAARSCPLCGAKSTLGADDDDE